MKFLNKEALTIKIPIKFIVKKKLIYLINKRKASFI